MSKYAVFDGHNDVLARLFMAGGAAVADRFVSGRPQGHLDLDKANAGGFIGGLFAIWVPNSDPSPRKQGSEGSVNVRDMQASCYNIPLSSEVPVQRAQRIVLAQADTFQALVDIGALAHCRTAQAINAAKQAGKIAAVLHLEGCEAIDADFAMLDALYARGLRSLGPVWSRPTRFGEGVPFRFPGSPDIGDGLTEDGKRLIGVCNEKRILVDVSHLNEKGFWDVAQLSHAPMVASHSNAHALCPHARNLTDKQLDAVAASNGIVGVNFATAFVRPDGRMVRQTPVELIVDHLAYMVDRMGEEHVAFGSDFDGAVVPAGLGTAAGLPVLTKAMEDRGFGAALVDKITYQNWLRVLHDTLGG